MKRKLLFLTLSVLVVIVVAFSFSLVGCAPSEVAPETEPDNNNEVLPAELKGMYPDGRYRGAFHDSGVQQVGIQFNLENNTLQDLSYRVLAYDGNNYQDPEHDDNAWPAEDLMALTEQYEQLLEYLEGRDISEIAALYNTETIVDDVEGTGEIADTWTGATVRGTKIINAIRDGLNRGIY